MQNNTNKTEKESNDLVREFFDHHAPDYRSKYVNGSKFYRYFFFERLEKTIADISFVGKSVLDIGAGTGSLYDYLIAQNRQDYDKYDAIDISSSMLEESNIPRENRFVGDFVELELSIKYDMIFLLGVSTYLSRKQMFEHIKRVRKLLQPGGLFIVTFTNRLSLDIQMRKLLKPFVKFLAKKDKVISQDFETNYYSRKEIHQLFDKELTIFEIVGLNHTFFPFSRMFQTLSVQIAKYISKCNEGDIKNWLSSDLLVKVIKK